MRANAERIRENYPPSRQSLEGFDDALQQVMSAKSLREIQDALDNVRRFIAKLKGSAPEFGETPVFMEKFAASVARIASDAQLTLNIQNAVDTEIDAFRFVAGVMQMCSHYRMQRCSTFAPSDELALQMSYGLLARGVHLPRCFEPLRKSSRRKHQTYLSFADPGEGHIKVTVRDSSLLDGTIVHIEWIDRDAVDNKELVEAYRLSSPVRAAQVRLHVGAETPCTAFIGRPVFEAKQVGQGVDAGAFEISLLKAAHTVAGTCSAMFAQGIVDCKIAMDNMKASEAVTFMRGVAGNVIRDAPVQFLSAAFNVNTPIVDDRAGPGPLTKKVSDPFEIARLGIELVKQGRFDKIAWDGASNKQPSEPILGQLSRPDLLRLVHKGHECNLETYISAGMVSSHMRDAVYIGVGGVGIGTSLHHLADTETKRIGEIDPQRVRDALKIRNEAEAEVGGQAAAKLAQLDWRWAEGSLPRSIDDLRQELFNALLRFNEQKEAATRKGATEDQHSEKELSSILDRVGQLQIHEEEAARIARASIPVDERGRIDQDHPVVVRADRIISAYASGVPLVGRARFTDQQIADLRDYRSQRDVSGMARVFAEADEVAEPNPDSTE